MKGILIRQIGTFEVADLDLRAPGAGEVVVKVHVTGLCRTDLKIIRVGHRDLVLPRVPGEEVIGAVCKVGEGVAADLLGQRVYVYPGVWCGECAACRRGAENLCREMRIMGFHRDGGFAEYVIAPARSLIPVPASLSDEEAVFAEPLSCCLNALELAGVEAGMAVGVWGAGPAGTLLVRAAKAKGASCCSVEPDERRRGLVGGYASSPDQGFDVCVVAVGAEAAYREALARLNPRGVLVVFSGLARSEESIPVNLNQLHYHEQALVGAYGCCWRHGRDALDLLAGRKIEVRDMISHRMPLWELDKALSIVERREGMKVLLYP